MVPKVSLAKKVKGCGEEQGHQGASCIIKQRIGEQDPMLSFMNYRIDRVHQDPENYSQQK